MHHMKNGLPYHQKSVKRGFGKTITEIYNMIKIVLRITCVVLLFCSNVSGYFDPIPYPEIRELTFEQSNELLKESMNDKERFECLVHYYFSPIWEVIPYRMQDNILDTAYLSLEEALESLRYCKRWSFEAENLKLFQKWPIDIFVIQRTDLGRTIFQTYIVYLQESNTYYFVSLNDFSVERFNELVKVQITTCEQALDYAKDVVSLITPHGCVIDQDMLNPEGTWYYTIKRYLDVVFLPKVTLQTTDFYVIEMFYFTGTSYGSSCDISKVIVIVNNEGKVSLLREKYDLRR